MRVGNHVAVFVYQVGLTCPAELYPAHLLGKGRNIHHQTHYTDGFVSIIPYGARDKEGRPPLLHLPSLVLNGEDGGVDTGYKDVALCGLLKVVKLRYA